MAALASDYSVSDAFETAAQEATDGIGEYVPKWALFANPADSGGDKRTKIRRYHDKKPLTLAAWNGSDNIVTGDPAFATGPGPTQTVEADGKALGISVSRHDWEADPQAAAKKVPQLIQAVTRTIDKVVFELLAALFTTTYSDGTGSPKIIDDGSTLHSTASPATWTNNVQMTLSESALAAGLALGQRAKNFGDDEPVDCFGDESPKVLIVPPELYHLATKLTGSRELPALLSTVVGQTDNVFWSQPWTVISSAFLTNTSRYLCIDRDKSPIFVWMPVKPLILVDLNPQTHAYEFTVSMSIKAWCDVPPYGIWGNSV